MVPNKNAGHPFESEFQKHSKYFLSGRLPHAFEETCTKVGVPFTEVFPHSKDIKNIKILCISNCLSTTVASPCLSGHMQHK
jgi:hypothetical protein